MEEVFVVSDNGSISIFRSEEKARKEWLELVSEIRNGKYFSPESQKTTKEWMFMDDELHILMFSIHNDLLDHDLPAQVWYAKQRIR